MYISFFRIIQKQMQINCQNQIIDIYGDNNIVRINNQRVIPADIIVPDNNEYYNNNNYNDEISDTISFQNIGEINISNQLDKKNEQKKGFSRQEMLSLSSEQLSTIATTILQNNDNKHNTTQKEIEALTLIENHLNSAEHLKSKIMKHKQKYGLYSENATTPRSIRWKKPPPLTTWPRTAVVTKATLTEANICRMTIKRLHEIMYDIIVRNTKTVVPHDIVVVKLISEYVSFNGAKLNDFSIANFLFDKRNV